MNFSLLQTFNEFFIRELKPGARPITNAGCDDVAVCAADCRLMAFETAEDSTRFWIKVWMGICYNSPNGSFCKRLWIYSYIKSDW